MLRFRSSLVLLPSLDKYAGMHNPQVFCLSREKCIHGYVLSPTVISSGDLQHAKTLTLHVLLVLEYGLEPKCTLATIAEMCAHFVAVISGSHSVRSTALQGDEYPGRCGQCTSHTALLPG